MRSGQEMMQLILGCAREDDRIRAAYMNGSRTNPNAKPDIFQDFDIVYVVTDVHPFVDDKAWLTRFGEICVMQEPDATALPYEKTDLSVGYAYLMQFEDGNRIDLTLLTMTAAKTRYSEDSLTVPLLDKDGLLPEIPPPSDMSYYVQKPTAAQFASCCNEFWWVCPYVAKGLWRNEILFALDHLDTCIRRMLRMMLGWEVAARHGFAISTGKCDKLMPQYLPKTTWERLLKTYPAAETDAVWDALFEATRLFHDTATRVAEALDFRYDMEEERRTLAFLEDVRKLPANATAIR
jgi:aminoglycoside 6-adenylyltransferase